MESVHSLQLKFSISTDCSIIVEEFNTHTGKYKAGSLDSELVLHRHKNGFLGLSHYKFTLFALHTPG